MSHLSFKDKVAIVTGGASGIGRALCLELSAREIAAVVVADINLQDAQETASAIVDKGGKAHSAQLDVSEAAEVQALIDDMIAQYGHLDYMFNNAGIAMWGEARDMNLEQWRRIFDINLWGVVHGTMSAYRAMIAQGHGHIINTASLAGLVPTPMETAYTATKHAVVGFSTALRAEAAGLGVKVSVVCPGPIQTGIFSATTYVTRYKNTGGDESPLKIKMTTADQCAKLILKGVSRNRGIITVTPYARKLWLLYRLHPGLVFPLFRQRIETSRVARIE